MEVQLPGKSNVEAEASAEAAAKAQTSKMRTNKFVRVRSKALKKSPASNILMAKKGKGSLPVEGKDRHKSKKTLQGKRESFKIESEDGKNHNQGEMNTENKLANKEVIEKDQKNEVNQENIAGSSKDQKNKKHEMNQDGSAKNLRGQKTKGKPERRDKIQQDEKKKGKLVGREEIQRDERKKEKLGGLIFMCSAKTKPDCFRYRVMGISMNRKDLVLGLKPGIKLFLYDFDLKLMYGIYEASSSGGLKLEPKAFAGSFPVQVRFRVYKDCFPLPENVFKKAIKENYNKNNKFDTELTVQQVRKLSQLFRPASFPSAHERAASIPVREARESRVHPDRELVSRVNQEYPRDRSYSVRSHERDHQYIDYQESGSRQREEINSDLYMSEKDYRTYGLKGEKRRLTPPRVTSISDQYQTDRERELLLRQTDPVYRHSVPPTREAVLVNPLYLASRELKSKKTLQGKRESFKIESEDGKNHNQGEMNTENKLANKEVIEKDQKNEVNQENIAGSSKDQKNKKHEMNQDGSAKNLRGQKTKGKPERRDKIQQDEKKKGKLVGREEIQRDERKKEKLGGLIFMCSAKTKPDCFRYRVMGISMNRKDLVLGLKPGIKLFLYDFDLKLMYGIYEASSSGGLKLEPKAFAGSFPVQVRFRVYKDCFPLPENVFKKAIKENYNKNNKFDTELTVQQVRKLSQLFRPASFPSAHERAASIPVREARESRVHPDRELVSRVNQEYPRDRSYSVRSHERDHQYIDYQESGSRQREEINSDLYMSEKDYRTYGLKGEKRRLTPPRVTSISDQYQTDRERELLLRQTDPVYRHSVPPTREAVLVNPLYLASRELHSYNPTRQELSPPASLRATTVSSSVPSYVDLYTREPYHTSVDGSSSVGAYFPPPRREEVSYGSYLPPPRREELSSGPYLPPPRREAYYVEADSLRGRETDQLDNLYAKYAADPISSYNQLHNYHTARLEIEPPPPPVSSRYSFAGPSLSYHLP